MTARRWKPVLVATLVALFVILAPAGCGGSNTGSTGAGPGSTTAPAVTTTSAAGQPAAREFTPAELAGFDGKNGNPGYIAVDGVVYDVSDSSRWSEGVHSVCNLGSSAGNDLSEAIKQAPSNMRALVERLPVVGSLVK